MKQNQETYNPEKQNQIIYTIELPWRSGYSNLKSHFKKLWVTRDVKQ